MQKVESLDEDRILRRFVNAVQSALRTNFFQTDKDGQLKPLISVKFQSRNLTDLLLPRPLYEIFVYSPRVEGVHMAGPPMSMFSMQSSNEAPFATVASNG